MNCNDRFQPDRFDEERKIAVTIPLHKILNWYRDWRIRKTKLECDKCYEYEDVVRDYIQDQ